MFIVYIWRGRLIFTNKKGSSSGDNKWENWIICVHFCKIDFNCFNWPPPNELSRIFHESNPPPCPPLSTSQNNCNCLLSSQIYQNVFCNDKAVSLMTCCTVFAPQNPLTNCRQRLTSYPRVQFHTHTHTHTHCRQTQQDSTAWYYPVFTLPMEIIARKKIRRWWLYLLTPHRNLTISHLRWSSSFPYYCMWNGYKMHIITIHYLRCPNQDWLSHEGSNVRLIW